MPPMLTRLRAGLLAAMLLLPLTTGCAVPAVYDVADAGGVVLLDDRVLRPDDGPRGIPMGGLSDVAVQRQPDKDGIGRYLFITDDRLTKWGPARVLSAEIAFDLDRHRFRVGDREWLWLTAQAAPGVEIPRIIDGEALRVAPDTGHLIWASEGDVWRKVLPGIHESTTDGVLLRNFPLPPVYVPDAPGARRHGIRPNKGFEAMDLSPDGQRIIMANEDSLTQDQSAADARVGPLIRVTTIDRHSGAVMAAHAYRLDLFPEPAEPGSEGGVGANGAVSLLLLEDGRYLMLERGFRRDAGVRIRLYLADPRGATDVSEDDRLDERAGHRPIQPAQKRLIGDLIGAGLRADNWEGMAFGPDLPDGRKTLVLVSDDNFNRLFQSTIIAWIALPSFD